MGSPLVIRQISNFLVVHLFLKLTGLRISACNCIYQLRGRCESDITGLSCKQTVSQSQLGILRSWAILEADKFGRFLHDRQIFVGRFYWQTKLANFIVRLTSA